MNLNEIQSAWDSPRNRPSMEEQQQLARQFTRQMIRRRRFRTVWLINTFVWLTLITALVIRNLASGRTDVGQEWGLFPLLLAPWAFALYFLRRHLKPAAPLTHGELSLADSFRAARASTLTEKSHLKLVGVLFVIIVPLLALGMRQLHTTGKMSEHDLACMAAFFGGVLLLSAGGIAARYFGRLRPQEKRLDELLMELAHRLQ